MNTLAVPTAVETLSPLPAERNPARVYIAGLAEGASRVTMESTLNLIAKMLGGTIDSVPWQDLRYEHLSRFRTLLQEQDKAPGTVNKYLAALRGTVEAAWKMEMLSTDQYTRAVKIENVKGSSLPAGRALSHLELEKFADTIADDHGRKPQLSVRDAAIFAAMYNTGLRRAELVNLDLVDYDREALSLHIRHGKGNKARMVYLEANARDAMDAWVLVRGSDEGPLFNRVLKNGVVVPTRLAPESVYTLLKSRQLQCGGKSFSPHSLRRTTVTDLIEAGVPINTVRDVMGHASVVTTSRYDRSGEKAKIKAATKLQVPYSRPVAA